MNEHQFFCQYQNNHAALERILRVVRVRGFELRGLHTFASGNLFTATLTVRGQRPISQLLSQLEKLVDVTEVQMVEAMAAIA